MTLLSTIFPGRRLISRVVYPHQAGAYTITAPASAAFIRASLVGGGAHLAGAAFARTKAVATPGETFNLVVGNCATVYNGAAGNTVLTRNTGSVIICRADGAEAGVAGTVAGSIGDTTRAGTVGSAAGAFKFAGQSGGDDLDPYPLGYGGGGAYLEATSVADSGNRWLAAYWGAGGLLNTTGYVNADGPIAVNIWPGQGRATVEFFSSDPGY